jgi:hypothetical protein
MQGIARRGTVVLCLLLAGLATVLLAACGGGRTQSGLIRRINPPTAGIDGLSLQPAAVRVTVRLQNYSTIPMRYGAVEAAVRIDGRDAGLLRFVADIEVPGLSSDTVAAELSVDAATRGLLDAAAASGRPFDYALEGDIETVEPEQRFDFKHESRLSPVPGRPGEFR